MRTKPPLTAPLFRSAGQAAILAEVLLGPGESVGLAALSTRTGVPRSSAYREVIRLAEAGILSTHQIGRELQVSASAASPLVAPLRQILSTVYGPAVLLTEGLAAIPGIESAVIFGSFAARSSGIPGPPPHDIDVLIVGDVAVPAVYDLAQEVTAAVSRPVHPVIMSPSEWQRAQEKGSAFARDVKARPTIPLIGDLRDPAPPDEQAT